MKQRKTKMWDMWQTKYEAGKIQNMMHVATRYPKNPDNAKESVARKMSKMTGVAKQYVAPKYQKITNETNVFFSKKESSVVSSVLFY